MKIALVGASGNVGSRILQELVTRNHQVTAIARNPEKIPVQPGITPKKGDVADKAGLADLLKGHDAVISALRFQNLDAESLIDVVRASGVKRYLVVGGASSLEVAPDQILLNTPDFPDIYKPEASKGVAFLELLKGVKDLDWTFLSPSAFFVPGERTGKFRLGKDQLLSNAEGKSIISYEDYSIALADEIEKPRHIRQRFTVGY